MNIKVSLDRSIEKNYFYTEGTQNENNVTKLYIEVPKEYEDYGKRIVFITDESNFWDYINNNEYTIKNNITKYEKVIAYIWLTKEDDDFRSKEFELNFYNNTNADDVIPTPSEIDGFAALIDTVELEIQKVKDLDTTLTNNEIERNKKVEESINSIKNLTEEYNKNAEEKTNEFNENAKSKMEDLNNIVAEIDSINFTLDEETGALYVIKQKNN